MKKVLATLISLVIVSVMPVAVFANTLSVEYDLPAVTNGVNLVDAGGTLIGNEEGWGGNAAAGRDAAFDGDETTFFDPLGVGDGYCGVQMDKPYILTEIRIMPRSGQLPRFAGALVQGSNDGENWTTILENFLAAEEEYTFYAFTPDNAGDAEWTAQTEGYTMFRYFNETNHGDVAEVELYGVPADGSTAPVVTETTETEAPATETTETVETPVVTAPATGDIIAIVAVVAVASLGATAVLRKKDN